jgi:hypothetical protein
MRSSVLSCRYVMTRFSSLWFRPPPVIRQDTAGGGFLFACPVLSIPRQALSVLYSGTLFVLCQS